MLYVVRWCTREAFPHLFFVGQETIADLDNMLDRKENMLDRLHDEYKIAEDQYERSVTAHKNLLDQFMGRIYHTIRLFHIDCLILMYCSYSHGIHRVVSNML